MIRKQWLAYPLRKRFLLERRKLRISIRIAQSVLQASRTRIESHGRLLGGQQLVGRLAGCMPPTSNSRSCRGRQAPSFAAPLPWMRSHLRSASAVLEVTSPTDDDAGWESLAANSAANSTRVITSVNELRRVRGPPNRCLSPHERRSEVIRRTVTWPQVYGSRRSWFGDLNAAQTRALYHSLLPTALMEESNVPLAERARLAVQV